MYIDCLYKRHGDDAGIYVVERVNGQRVFKTYKPDFHFYISDPAGEYRSIYGNPVKRMNPASYAERAKFLKSKSENLKTWESDVDPILRCLEAEYKGKGMPTPNVAFFDIETDYDPVHGWSSPKDALNKITSISVHLQWLDQMVCLAIPPKTITWEEAEVIADRVGDVILFKDEAEMLKTFMQLIDDADIISGWNSEFYDVPYIINRIKTLMGKYATMDLCLWGQMPREREYERGGKVEKTFDLVGRVHLDYLELYKKYNPDVKASYKLQAIAEDELGDSKVEYDGTLDDLYNDDFELFLQYNIQDTRLLDKLDKKKRYMSLINKMAHDNCVLLPNVMGTVTQSDQAMVMQAHDMGYVVMDKVKRNPDDSGNKAAGGWVAIPKVGLHKNPASTDCKSLYPSVIRGANISPETIIGQIRTTRTNEAIAAYMTKGPRYTFAGWWNDRFNTLEMEAVYERDKGTILTLDMESGESFELSGYEVYELVFNSGQPWHLSANGTIFSHEKQGVIPALLARWYAERVEMKKRMFYYDEMMAGMIVVPDRVKEMFGLTDEQ